MIKLGIVSPCYNEAEVLPISIKKFENLFINLISKNKISKDSFIMFVNDGSKDSTWELITEYNKQTNINVYGINLTHNTGHQNAIMAGMMTAYKIADAVITIDADIQDDLNCIEKMVDLCEEGNDVVYGVKTSRKKDSFLKRFTAESFYKLQRSMGVDTIFNHADFRLMKKETILRLSEYKEKNLFLRGLMPIIGYKTAYVNDIIGEREAGKSKYTLSKMLKLATDGIFSFSTKPISMIFVASIVFFFLCFLSILYILYGLITNHIVPGWASIMASLWFIGAFIMLALGIIGEYIGKIYIEVKNRPLYHIQQVLTDGDKTDVK